MGSEARRRDRVPQTHPGLRVKPSVLEDRTRPECRAWLAGLVVLFLLLVVLLPLGGFRDSRVSSSLAGRMGAAAVEVPVR